jgi:hypothetical protein
VQLAGAKPLECEQATTYRSLVMHINNVAQDRPDLSYAAGSLARGMKSPTTKHWEELKRVGRYLRCRLVGTTVFEPQTPGDVGGVLRRRLCRRP